MKRLITLNQNRDFRRLYHRSGKVAPLVVTYACKNRLGYNRIGITTSKKIGKAHDRNRARRVIKEAYRLLVPQLCSTNGWDIVFVARVRTTKCSMQEVQKQMKKHLFDCMGID